MRAGQWLKGTRKSGGVAVDLAPGRVVYFRPVGPAVFQLHRHYLDGREGAPGRLQVRLRRGMLLVCAPELSGGDEVDVLTTYGTATLQGPGAMGVRATEKDVHVFTFRGAAWASGAYEVGSQRRAVPAGSRASLTPGSLAQSALGSKIRRRWLQALEDKGCPEACVAQLLSGPAARPASWLAPRSEAPAH